jgi:hypothetical protein
MGKETYTKNDFADSRVAWFVCLERAKADNNFERAAMAKKELERLGVRVKYLRKRRASEGAGND